MTTLTGEVFDDVPLGKLLAIGGPQLARAIAGLFLSIGPTRGAELAAAAAARDWPTCGRLAHNLRSAAGNVGARRVQALAEQMEHAVTDGETAKVAALAPLAVAEIASAVATLQAWLDSRS